jgi:FkbM family methyltransferase
LLAVTLDGEEDNSMFTTVPKPAQRRAAALHEFFRRLVRYSKFPVPRLLNGRFTLTASNLIGTTPTEPHVLRWIDELLRPRDTFVDVGAHHGWMSLLACHRVGASGKVVAFEPSPPLAKLLQYNKKVNGFRQMEIVSKAVADSDNSLVPFYLVDGGDSFLNSLINHPVDASTSRTGQKSVIQVETVTLDEFCKVTDLHPKAVKIDIEGGELLALQGCAGLLKDRRTAFIVAVHPTWLPAGQKVVELFDLFRALRYRIAASQFVRYDGADFGDYLFVPD